MSSNKIHDLVSSFAKQAENQEKLATPLLASKLAKSLQQNPHDQTIGGIFRVLESMVNNNKNFIRKSELKDLYKRFYVVGTKFAQVMESDLGDISYQPQIVENKLVPQAELDMYAGGNEILANALTNAFDATTPLRPYSEKTAKSVQNMVASELSGWNLPASKLAIEAGNESFLIIKAEYDTPKGLTSFLVPVDISKTSKASIFVGNFGPEELNNKSIKKYITQNAGSKLQVNASAVLGILVKAAAKNTEITQTEVAALKLAASKQAKSEFIGNQILGQTMIQEGKQDVQFKTSSAEVESLEKKFNNVLGHASWKFGSDKLAVARNLINNILSSFGYKSPQIAVSASNDSTIFHSVSLNGGKLAFTVPVKVSEGKVITPKLLICNGSPMQLSQVSIASLSKDNMTDARAAATASPQFGLKPSDLLNNLRTAMSSANYLAAEDALNILKQSGDEKAYAIGFEVYLSGLNKTASVHPSTSCSKLIKSATSQYMTCSHTGLPEHKVYQDADGNCRPLYRKGMDETYEAASFINSKIFG